MRYPYLHKGLHQFREVKIEKKISDYRKNKIKRTKYDLTLGSGRLQNNVGWE
jgi:hypothetical protein